MEKQNKNKKTEKKCPKCMGFGWWGMGYLSPIGEMDAGEMRGHTTKCPWCGKGDLEDERFQYLKKVKKKEDENKKNKNNS